MRTTIDIHDALLERAKRYAEGHGQRLAEVVNDALIEKLSRENLPPASSAPFRFLTFGQGGPKPGIDLDSNASILDAEMEALRDPVTGQLDLDKLR